MSKPYSSSTHKATYNKGTILKIVDSDENKYGNLWYKTEKGYWIYSGNIRKHSCSASTPATKKWYEKKNNTKHVYKTETPAAVCKCGETVKKKSTSSTNQDHSWNDVGKCKNCGYEFSYSLSTWLSTGEYMVKSSVTQKSKPYSAASNKGSKAKYDIVNVVGYANNAFGNKWYKTSEGAWIYESYVEKHSHSSYTDTGYCSCKKPIKYSTYSMSSTQKELTADCTSRVIPFPKAGTKTTYSKGQVINVVAKDEILYPDWYKTSNGDWIQSSKLKDHSHNYSGGICKNAGCKMEFALKEKALNDGKAVLYETTGANKVLKYAPYSNRETYKTISKSGTVIALTHKAKNSAGNWWYRTSDKRWIYEDNIKKHEHKTVSGKCVSPDCTYDFGVRPTTFSPTSYIVLKANEPYYTLPYSDSTKKGTYPKDKIITINAEFKNNQGNWWYRTSGGYWIYSKAVDKHEHTYKKGACKDCGADQPLTVKNITPTVYITTSDKVNVWARPYSDSIKKKTIQTKGTKITIIGSVVNDAKNLWYKTSEGYWVYSGNVEKASTGTVAGSNTVKSDKYVIKVIDIYKKAISGAKVTFGSQSATTNSQGYAELPYSSSTNTLKVTASNYDTHSETYTMKKVREDTITLIESGKYALTKANIVYKNTTTDVRMTEVTVNQASNNLKFDLTLGSNVPNIKEYRLVQDGKTILTSTNGKFTSLTADKFKRNKPVLVHVIGKDGKTKVNSKLQLNVIYSQGDVPETLSLGSAFKITLPKDLPHPFAGMSASLNIPTCPIGVDVNGDSLRLSLNFKVFDTGKPRDEEERAWDYLKRLNPNKFKDFYSGNALKAPPKYTDGQPLSLGVKVGGYAEGSIKNMSLKGKLFVAIEVSAWQEAQLSIPVPIVGEISFEGKLQANGSITITKAGVTDGSLDISLELGLGLYLGAGVAGIVSVGAYGKGSITMDAQILPQAYIDSIYASAKFGVKAKLFGKNIWDVTVVQLGNLYLYRRGADLSEYEGVEYVDLYQLIYDEDNYVTMDRSYLEERSGWYEESVELMEDEEVEVSQFDFATIQSSTYTDIKPQVVTTGHTIMMVYTDDNANRADDDRTMLVYSLFNKDTEKWSEPQPVYDDGTADFNYSVTSTGDEIYVVWQNVNETLSPDMSLTEISKKIDLQIAKFDEAMGSFQNVETVTYDNNKYELMPRVASLNGNTIVTWFENSEDDIYGHEGSNVIRYALKSNEDYAPPTDYYIDESGILPEGTELEAPAEEEISDDLEVEEDEKIPEQWISRTVEGEQPAITSLAAGYMLDGGYIAFTIDADGDTTTIDDQEIRLIDVDNPEIVSYTNQAMNVEFTKVHGDEAMTWFNQGHIYYALDSIHAPQMLYSGTTIPADEYHIISSENGNMAVLYTIKGEDQSDAYMILYDDETYEWGDPIQITKQDKYIQNFNGAYYDEMIVSIFNQTEVSSEDLFEKNNLCCALVGERQDIMVEDVIFDDMDLEPNTEYPMTIKVKNNGTVRMDNILVSVYAGDEVIVEKTVPTSIKPGETVNVETAIMMPSEIQTTEYIIFAEKADGNDADISNNRFTMTVGKTLMKISAEQSVVNDKNIVTISVTNTGYNPAGGSIVLYDDSFNVSKILYENIDEIGHNETFICNVEFSEDDFGGEMYKSFNIGVLPAAEQYLEDYNTTSIMVKSAVISDSSQLDIETVVLDQEESEDGISLMGEFKKSIAGRVRNETEEDYEAAKVCVVAYDGRGIYLDTQVVEVSLMAGEMADFAVEFDTDMEVEKVKVMLLDDANMKVLSDYIEIMSEVIEEDSEMIDEEELYTQILADVEEY